MEKTCNSLSETVKYIVGFLYLWVLIVGVIPYCAGVVSYCAGAVSYCCNICPFAKKRKGLRLSTGQDNVPEFD